MVKEIFEHTNYREYLRNYFKSLPREGFGQLTKAAKAIGVQSSLLTGILQGTKNLTPEQALDFTEYLQLSELEAEYFISLVQFDRAGTPRLRKHLQKKLAGVREKSNLLKNRLPPQAELPEQIKAQFYSQWYFSAIRMASSIETMKTPDQFAEHFGLNRQLVMKVLDFLTANNLVLHKNGEYQLGPQSTHVGAGEMLVSRHHTNWRLKAIEKIETNPATDLHFTSPVSISAKDFEVVRKLVTQTIDQIFAVVDPSPADEIACLCFDWFKMGK